MRFHPDHGLLHLLLKSQRICTSARTVTRASVHRMTTQMYVKHLICLGLHDFKDLNLCFPSTLTLVNRVMVNQRIQAPPLQRL